jgi:hypothetical protein
LGTTALLQAFTVQTAPGAKFLQLCIFSHPGIVKTAATTLNPSHIKAGIYR